MQPAEITPDCPDCCLCTLRSIDRLLRGLSGRSVAFWALRFSADTAMCGSRCAARVEANAIARRALLPSPLRCGRPSVGGSGADLCVCPGPLLTPLLRRSIRLCEWRLCGRPDYGVHVGERRGQGASARARVSARARAGVCMCIGPRVLHALYDVCDGHPGRDGSARSRRLRWCAARRTRQSG